MSDKKHDRELRTRTQRKRAGKALRKQVPRRRHGDWTPAPNRPDPISLLQAQDDGRIQELLPIKYGRMVASPFAFLRGSAAVMASDLATTPVTGIHTVLCGDAHLSNFGIFATPERRLVFDINDFDESYPGPWEWDLKRLAASAVVAGRENGFSDKKCRQLAVVVARSYRKSMQRFAQARTLDVWYFHVEADAVLRAFEKHAKEDAKSARKVVKKARTKTHEQTLEKLTELVEGRRQIINDPPLLVRLTHVLTEEQKGQITERDVKRNWSEYLNSLPEERRLLLSRFRATDVALRVGGVGSVGTRCTILLLEGGAEDDALILQQKEAGGSVLEPYLAKRGYASPAQRVVTNQRLMQAASDIFLGWHKAVLTGVQFYWRQLKDMKGSFDVASLDEAGMRTYLGVCSACLARAHARTGDAAGIWGYLGKSDAFDEAIGDFAVAYADQTERDHQALVEAVQGGRIAAETGI
jgi:uncharacterized protein (DUF2252 family)